MSSDLPLDRGYRRLIPMDMALVHHVWWTDTLCEEIFTNLISRYLIHPCTIRQLVLQRDPGVMYTERSYHAQRIRPDHPEQRI
jgi:hypothetical protein